MNTVMLALKLARREMRSGFSGFRIFFACLVLGVAAVAGVGSLSSALLTGLAAEGRVLLGGDVSIRLVHRPANAAELAFLARRGRVSRTVSMRAMAYALTGNREEERQLVELKAVDRAYPLYGSIRLAPAVPLPDALRCDESACGAIVERTLLERLRLQRNGSMRIGKATFRLSAMLIREPDRMSGGFSLGPHVIVSEEGLARTALVMPGSLIAYDYRLALPQWASIKQFRANTEAAFPDAGWEIRDRNDPAPGIRQLIEQATMFLMLVGLTTLAVGGVGASQAVTAFLDRKREQIAVLKALGAEGFLIFLFYFLQVMAVALAATTIGLAIGSIIPFLVEALFAGAVITPARFGLYPEALLVATLFGILSAMAFAIPPLARAKEITPAALFRDIISKVEVRGSVPYLAVAGISGLCILVIVLVLAASPSFAGWFMAAAAGGLVLLRAAAWGLSAILSRLPSPGRPGLRLALANLRRPGAVTTPTLVALGLGLSLLAAVMLLDRTISSQVKDDLPATAPTFFFVDIQSDETLAFDETIRRFQTASDYKRTPMIRGRITALDGMPAANVKVASGARWALSGDRGITYAASEPKGTDLVSGQWWPPDYRGPTLISFDAELARGLGLKLGDTVTLNVLGRELTGRIVNLRRVNFMNGRQNFILILSPGLIDKAPHSYLATVRVPPRDEEALYRAVTDRFPGVTTVRVKDTIAEVDGLLRQLSEGMSGASLLTIAAGLLVLSGAVAAGQRARIYDATVMKVLGATRLQIVTTYAIEYAVIGALTGLIALGLGTAAAAAASRGILGLSLDFDLPTAAGTVAGGTLATLGFGLLAAWSALAAKPAERLRHP